MAHKDPEKRKAYERAYYEKNKERIKARSREYHWRNRKRCNAKSKEYHLKHKEERKEYCKKYREENREKLLRLGKEYRKANPNSWKEWYLKNKDSRDKYTKEYRADPINKKRIKKVNKNFRDANPDYWAKWRPVYEAANPKKAEERKKHHRKWLKENKDKCYIYQANRRAQKINSTLPDTDQEAIAKIYKKQKRLNEAAGETKYHVDHIIPLSIGGAHHQDNLRVVPAEENLQKKDKYVPELGGIWADNELAKKTKKKLGIK